MNKKIIAAVFAGLLVTSFANIAIVNCDDVSGYYKYKMVCKAPSPIIFDYDTEHSSTTTITEAKINPTLTLYHTVVRAELHYVNNGYGKTMIKSSKKDNLSGKTSDDNSITVKKKINHSNFTKTAHDMTLGGVGKNYSVSYSFKSPGAKTGTRNIS